MYVTNQKAETERHVIDTISTSLSLSTDVTSALKLKCNTEIKKVTKGQKQGHSWVLLSRQEAKKVLSDFSKNKDVLHPYLTGDEMISNANSQPPRFVIDFTGKDINQASTFKHLYKIIEAKVLPKRKEDAEKEIEQNKQLIDKNPKARIAKSYPFLCSYRHK